MRSLSFLVMVLVGAFLYAKYVDPTVAKKFSERLGDVTKLVPLKDIKDVQDSGKQKISDILNLFRGNDKQSKSSLYTIREKSGVEVSTINVYSARKEELVRDLFNAFQARTGIKVNLITDEAGKLLARLESERAEHIADVFWTADFQSIAMASGRGLLEEDMASDIRSQVSSNMSGPTWVAVTKRARVIAYSKHRVKPEELKQLQRYEDLALPIWEGRLATRSSSSGYNQFLISSMISHDGVDRAAKWCRGIANNLARSPQGGDTDQIRAIASGVADVALVNHYYYLRLLNSTDAKDRKVAKDIGIIYPNQKDRGTHINISAIGIAKGAPHKKEASDFIRFLLSDEIQSLIVAKNSEYPVVDLSKASTSNTAFSNHKFDSSPLSTIADLCKDADHISVLNGWR